MNRVEPLLVRVAAVGWTAFGLYLILCFVALIVMRRNVRIPAPPAVESGSRPCSGSRRTACQGGGDEIDPLWRDFEHTNRGDATQ